MNKICLSLLSCWVYSLKNFCHIPTVKLNRWWFADSSQPQSVFPCLSSLFWHGMHLIWQLRFSCNANLTAVTFQCILLMQSELLMEQRIGKQQRRSVPQQRTTYPSLREDNSCLSNSNIWHILAHQVLKGTARCAFLCTQVIYRLTSKWPWTRAPWTMHPRWFKWGSTENTPLSNSL